MRPTHRSRRFVLAVVAAALCLAVAPLAPTAVAATHPASLKVMTRNLYLGADLAPAFTAGSLPELIQAATTIWGVVQATDFPERAEALADEIAAFDPHVVGLQEVELWRSQKPGDGPATPATTVEYDFLELLLDALEARGRHYDAAAVVTNFEAEAPRFDPTSTNFLQDIRLTDRDAILVRSDLPAQVFSVSNAQAENFEQNQILVSPVLGAFEVLRGWTAVDVTIRGRTARVLNTHLERFSPSDQVAQAQEILDGPADTALPVVFLGDLNSAAGAGAVPGESDTPTYGNVLAAGFADAWTLALGEAAGFTCCHSELLDNPQPTITERIDFVLVRGDVRARSVRRVGHRPEDRTPSGLWPSDHAGVAAVLRLG